MITELKKREVRLLKRIKASTDEVGALKIALDMEMESIRQTDAPAQKEIVCSLLKEEQHRYIPFENTCLCLSDPAGWYLWNEQSFVDGGTSWA